MSKTVYSKATWLGNGRSGGSMIGGPSRGVLHTTETKGLPSYDNGNSAPHFTVMPDGKVYQHTVVSTAARTLRNESGGVETNRQGEYCVNIEIVGYSKNRIWPEAQVKSVVDLMKWCEQYLNIPFVYNTPFGSAASAYGKSAATRMSNLEWWEFSGWCAHHNVPENTHWDIGEYLPVEIRLEMVDRVIDVVDYGQKVGVDDNFREQWEEMVSEGVFTQYTDPDGYVRAEALAVFIDRYHDRVVKPMVAAINAALDSVENASTNVGVDQEARETATEALKASERALSTFSDIKAVL